MIIVNIYDNELMAQNKAVSDSVKFETVKFIFPDSWNDYVKTAVFKDENGKCVNIVLGNTNPLCIDETECYIPHEMLLGEYFIISVFGVKGDSLATTTEDRIEVLKSGYAQGGAPKDPTPSEYQQLTDLAETARQIAVSVRTDADYGLFNGRKGDKGDKGDQGPKGDKGDPSDINKEYVAKHYAPIIENSVSGTILRISDAINEPHKMSLKLTSDTVTDFTNMRIRKYGKNILHSFIDGVNFDTKYNGSICEFPAAALRGKYVNFQVKADFTNTIEETATMNCSIQFLDQNGTQINRVWSQTVTPTSENKVASLSRFVSENVYEIRCYLSVFFNGAAAAQSGSIIRVENLMFEIGDKATKYERYSDPEMIYCDANGNTSGALSLQGDMTLFADLNSTDLKVECGYKVDTKKYLDNKFAEITAMILEVL